MLLSELLNITEARKSELTYSEKKVKDEIDRVIVALEGNESGKFTRLITRYKRLQKGVAALSEQQEILNAKMKEQVEDYFNAEDEVYTRVVDTISATMTIAKKTVATSKKVDYDAIIAGILELVPELTEKVDELKKQHTKITQTEKSPALRTTIKEDIVSDVFKMIKSSVKQLLSQIKAWGRSYDKRLNKVNSLISKI